MTTRTSCPHETDVLDLVAIGQWPGRADATLREHVASCEICADLASVASAIAELDDASRSAVSVPDATVVWYRAQVRAREDLARRASRPVLVIEVVAALCVLVIGFVAWQTGTLWLAEWWREAERSAFAGFDATEPQWIQGALTAGRWVLVAVMAWAIIIPGALFVARVADRSRDPQPNPPSRT
jgi:hypothetical protein